MNKFILKDGCEKVTDRFMQGPVLTSGYEWRHSHDKTWVETPIQPVEDASKIFGYDLKEFMKRQYNKL